MSTRDQVKNPDYVGDAQKAEKVNPSHGTQKVWDFECITPNCPKPEKKVKEVGQVPKKDCGGCGEWNWGKVGGTRERPRPAPKGKEAKA